jgi:hypothetical protein
MYSASLYCSDGGCCAAFDAEGTQRALASAFCTFCGSPLEFGVGEVEGDAAEEPDAPTKDLQLRVVQGPVGRALRHLSASD